jgi:hypothetical protein
MPPMTSVTAGCAPRVRWACAIPESARSIDVGRRPASASAEMYTAIVAGAAGSDTSPCPPHHAANESQSWRYVRRVAGARESAA